MAIPLKYNTAGQEIPLGHFVDSSDGDTEKTGLTIANTDIKLWKNGATGLVNKNSGGASHMANGVYYCTLDATDTNTYGPLVIFVHVSGALAVRVECEVMNSDAYDALYAANGTGSIETNVVEIEGSDPTDQINAACDTALSDYDPPTKTEMDSAHAATDGLITTVDGVVDGIKAVTDNLPDSGALTSIAQGSDLATVDGNVDAILADTGTDGVVLADSAIAAAKVAASGANKIADHTIRRSFQNACDSSDGDTKSLRSLLGAIAKLINKIAISGTTLTIYEDDDTTALGTQTVTTDSGADPITALDTT